MNRLAFVYAGLLLSITPFLGAHDRPATIQEFYDADSRTRVIAHRGFSGAAPENTIAAVLAAIEVGADMVEVDVTLSADGHLVVIHDEDIDRTTDGSGRVSQFTLAELQTLDAGTWFDPAFAGEHVPTLEEIFAVVKDRILINVEIKSEAVARGVVDRVASAIRTFGMVDQVVVSSFSPEALEGMHSAAPEIRTAVLFNTDHHEGQDAVEIVTELNARAFNIKRQRLTRTMRSRCREHGIPIGVYTVNKRRRMRRLVTEGIDAIFTDHPDRLLEVLDAAATKATVPTPAPLPAIP